MAQKWDANANVTQKNVATLEAELMKDFFCAGKPRGAQVSRKITDLFGPELAVSMFGRLKTMRCMFMTKPSLKLYCVSVTMYPILARRLKRSVGGLGANR